MGKYTSDIHKRKQEILISERAKDINGNSKVITANKDAYLKENNSHSTL